MDPMTAMWVDIAVATIANGIMIVLFFLINKYYWEPHRRGEPAFGGAFLGLQTYIHDHDFGKKSLTQTFAVAIAFMFVISAVIMGATAGFGSRDFVSVDLSESTGPSIDIDDMVDSPPEQTSGSNTLPEGNSETLNFESESEVKYIKSISVTVTWTDEADRGIRYENQPDTFSVSISGLNTTSPVAQASNPQGGQGSISADLSFTNDDIKNAIENGDLNYNVSVIITMVEAGNQEKVTGLPGLAFIDSGNQYDYTIDIIWLTIPEE
jgi:hypothetical protein